MRSCVWVLGLFLAPAAFAGQIGFQNFSWRADGRFELALRRDSSGVVVRGSLRDGERAEFTQGGLTAVLNSHSQGFVSVAVLSEDDDIGALFILERLNAQFVPLTPRAIMGRKATLLSDLDGVINGLKKVNNWDASLTFRAMTGYFAENPNRQLKDFYDQIELGNVKMAKPQPRSQPAGSSRELPPPNRPPFDNPDPRWPQRPFPPPPPPPGYPWYPGR
jgi:hypothetical protein